MSEQGTGDPRVTGSASANGGARPAHRKRTDESSRSSSAPSSGDASSSAGREPPRFVQKLKERREAYKQRGRAYRIAWVLAGVIVVVAGLVMVIFPGPALVVIPIGLAMLSLEFAWAERLLDTTVERGIDAKDIASNASRSQKIAGIAAIVCAIGAAVTFAVLYFF
jgi:uncharacterized protein (TIGR02611 family)